MKEIVLISGGGSGIGKALACKFAREGAQVLIFGRRLPQLLETKKKYPKNIQTLKADVSLEGDRENIKNFLEVNGYKVKYLIHNAAVLQPVKSLMDMELAEWRDHQAVNVEGPLFLTKTLLDYLTNGRVLHISSGAAHHAYQGWGAYCTSKAGLYMIYLVLKEELKRYKIAVGSVRPGVVDTPMQDEVRSADPEDFPALPRFLELKKDNKLFEPQAVADYIYTILTESSDEEFSAQEWDFTKR
jgi:NAD(P)-dependent dehydrogenase (short-subunit alcohol dehydrogenase family)